MSGTPYIASEDSALLREALRGQSGGSCLEIGAGNTGNLLELSGRFGMAVGTDLARPSMTDWKGGRADLVIADLASCFVEGTFDLVAFNPPYLPGESGDGAVDGGPFLAVPLRFLAEALRVVKGTGTVVFLLNDEADLGDIEEACARRGFELKLLLSKRMFFEELSVYAARRRD